MELVILPPSHDLSIQDTVPFAAVILDYPVAYVPVSPDQTIFLPWEVLDVYECILMLHGHGKENGEHMICKFSCPNSLSTRKTLLQVPNLQARLRALLTSRLQNADVEGEIEIRHHQETHERVVL